MNRSRNLIAMKKELDDREFHILQSEVERKKKSTSLTYVLWFFLSVFGIHKFYLGKIWAGILYIIAPSVAWIFLFAGLVMTIDPNELHYASEGMEEGHFMVIIGFMGFAAYVIWWFIDLFTIPNQVGKYNEEVEIETIEYLFRSGKQ